MCGPGQAAKQVLGRPHVSFRGLEYGPRQLVDRVENFVAGDLCKVYYGFSDSLVAPLLLLVQQRFVRSVQGQCWPYSGGVWGFSVFHTVALYHAPRVVLLADGDGPFLMVADDAHSEDS